MTRAVMIVVGEERRMQRQGGREEAQRRESRRTVLSPCPSSKSPLPSYTVRLQKTQGSSKHT